MLKCRKRRYPYPSFLACTGNPPAGHRRGSSRVVFVGRTSRTISSAGSCFMCFLALRVSDPWDIDVPCTPRTAEYFGIRTPSYSNIQPCSFVPLIGSAMYRIFQGGRGEGKILTVSPGEGTLWGSAVSSSFAVTFFRHPLYLHRDRSLELLFSSPSLFVLPLVCFALALASSQFTPFVVSSFIFALSNSLETSPPFVCVAYCQLVATARSLGHYHTEEANKVHDSCSRVLKTSPKNVPVGIF